MGIKEKIYKEIDNTNHIFLYKEGMFWRAYEVSAYNFVQNIQKYKVLKRYIKLVSQEVCFIGFPDNILDPLLLKYSNAISTVSREKNYVDIQLAGFKANSDTYKQWKSTVGFLQANDYNYIIAKINKFDLGKKTPMDCMQFLYELKTRMKLIEDQMALNKK